MMLLLGLQRTLNKPDLVVNNQAGIVYAPGGINCGNLTLNTYAFDLQAEASSLRIWSGPSVALQINSLTVAVNRRMRLNSASVVRGRLCERRGGGNWGDSCAATYT